MIVRGRDDQEVRLDQKTVDDFRAGLRGRLLLPEDHGYEQARTVWNAMIDRRPALIARCLGVADVMASVSFAREHDLLLSIKGGGHNIAGLAVCERGMMIDLSLMRGVWVDPRRQVARAQAGCLLGDLDQETQVHGLAAVLGFVSATGVAGLTLGGGFGYLTRRCGWTCDNLLSMEVVTAAGTLVRTSAEKESDLFWGLRGGGGNFGVVTNLEYKLFPVGPRIMGGIIAWPAEQAERVLAMYRALVEQAPPELTCAAMVRLAPPAPWLPKEIHGQLIVGLVVCHSGSLAQGQELVGPIKALGSAAGDIIQERTYASQQSLLDATQPPGRRYYWKSEYLDGLPPELLTRIMDHAQGFVSPNSAIVLFPVDGPLNQEPEAHSPMGNREAKVVLNITSSWERAEEDRANIDWTRQVWEDLRRFSTGGTYVNFLTEDEGMERTREAYRTNYDRLVEVKTRWDPENVFRMNKNIAPREG